MTKSLKASGKSITWKSVQAKTEHVQATEKNYKIASDLGKQRLKESVDSFGRAGTVVCNWLGKVGDLTKLMLIDGNSRWIDAKEKGEKMLWVSVPDRKLTPAEFKEFSAMFDFAKAGEVDMERIQQDLGTKEEWYAKWGLQVPMGLLDKMGKGAPAIEKLDYPETTEAADVSDIKMVQLFFSDKQEAAFRKMEEKLKKKYRVDSTTDCVFKAFKALTK